MFAAGDDEVQRLLIIMRSLAAKRVYHYHITIWTARLYVFIRCCGDQLPLDTTENFDHLDSARTRCIHASPFFPDLWETIGTFVNTVSSKLSFSCISETFEKAEKERMVGAQIFESWFTRCYLVVVDEFSICRGRRPWAYFYSCHNSGRNYRFIWEQYCY